MHKIVWLKDGEIILTAKDTLPAVPISNINHIYHIANGEISIKNISLGDAGLFRITVFYTVVSNLPTLSDSAYVSVKGRKLLKQS